MMENSPYDDADANRGLGGLVGEVYHPYAWSKFCLVLLTFSVIGNDIAISYSSGLSVRLMSHYVREGALSFTVVGDVKLCPVVLSSFVDFQLGSWYFGQPAAIRTITVYESLDLMGKVLFNLG
ncbi:hypothetical protein ACHAPX_010400 [Trichoderma viride]